MGEWLGFAGGSTELEGLASAGALAARTTDSAERAWTSKLTATRNWSGIRPGALRALQRHSRAERDANHEFPWDFYTATVTAGWIGGAIPEEYDGGGILEASIMLEEVAASVAAMNGASAIHLSTFGMHPVALHGSEDMRRRYLPRVAREDLHVAFGVTEPDAGTDTTLIRTVAVRDGDAYRIRGQNVWTSKALQARARAAPVPDHAEEKSRGRRPTGYRSSWPTCAIRRSAFGRSGKPGATPWRRARPSTTISSFLSKPGGGGEAGASTTCSTASSRTVPGRLRGIRHRTGGAAPRQSARRVPPANRPIGQNPGHRRPAGGFPRSAQRRRVDDPQGGLALDRMEPCGEDANLAKYLASEAAFQACDRALQTHGGFGYAEEYHVARCWREARLLRIAPLPQELLAYVAQHVLGLPRSY